jgi:hypothetical protein
MEPPAERPLVGCLECKTARLYSGQDLAERE